MRRIITPPLPSPSFELIRISSEPIRAVWIKRYRLLEKKLEKLKKEWRLFEQEAQPYYQKWYHQTFWKELGQVTEWTEKAREQQKILMAIVAHQQIYRLDEIEAYARVKERLRSKQNAFPDAEDVERYEAKERARKEAEQKRREEIRRRNQEESEKFWESVAEAENYAEEIEDAFARQENETTTPPLSRENSVLKRQDDLKTLYRGIVRELHPDTGHEMTELEKDWWNQAQVAYRNSDLETLKLLSLKIQGRGTISIESIEHVSLLIDLCEAIVFQQDEIERQKRYLKKDPVYRFWVSRTRTTNRDKLSFEIKAGLQHQFRKLREYVSDVKARLNTLDEMSQGYDQSSHEEEYNPRERHRTRLGGRGRGRGRGK
jgi:hypothetical protein